MRNDIYYTSPACCRRPALDQLHCPFDGVLAHNGFSGFVCRLNYRKGAISNLRDQRGTTTASQVRYPDRYLETVKVEELDGNSLVSNPIGQL